MLTFITLRPDPASIAFMVINEITNHADVAELVDALDSKSSSGNRVGVRFPPSVLYKDDTDSSPFKSFGKSFTKALYLVKTTGCKEVLLIQTI